MSLKIRKNKSSIFITLLLILALLTGLTAGYFSTHGITENGKFEAFSGKVFQNEVSGSTLTLHYTLAHPEKQGIRRKKASLGTVPTDMKNTYQICSQYEKKLKSFRYSRHGKSADAGLHAPLLPHGKITGRQLSASGASWPKSLYSGSASGSSGGICLL